MCKCKIEPFQEDIQETMNACGKQHCALRLYDLTSIPKRYPDEEWEDFETVKPYELHIVNQNQIYEIDK